MGFFKKLFTGIGFAAGFLFFGCLSVIVYASRGRHKPCHRRSSFWDTLTRYMIFAWIYDGVKKSREQVGRRYYRRPVRPAHPAQAGESSVSGRTLCGCVSGEADFIGGGQRPSLHRGCRGHRHELCDSMEQHPAGTPTAVAPLCGAGRRKTLRLLQRKPLQHRKWTDDRGTVSGQTGTSRFEDLVLKWPLNHSHQGIKPETRLLWQMLIF